MKHFVDYNSNHFDSPRELPSDITQYRKFNSEGEKRRRIGIEKKKQLIEKCNEALSLLKRNTISFMQQNLVVYDSDSPRKIQSKI